MSFKHIKQEPLDVKTVKVENMSVDKERRRSFTTLLHTAGTDEERKERRRRRFHSHEERRDVTGAAEGGRVRHASDSYRQRHVRDRQGRAADRSRNRSGSNRRDRNFSGNSDRDGRRQAGYSSTSNSWAKFQRWTKKTGLWDCPVCGNINLARNVACTYMGCKFIVPESGRCAKQDQNHRVPVEGAAHLPCHQPHFTHLYLYNAHTGTGVAVNGLEDFNLGLRSLGRVEGLEDRLRGVNHG